METMFNTSGLMLTPEKLLELQQLMGAGPQVQDPSAAAPFEDQANRYRLQAADLEREAAEPYAQPQGAKEHVVDALRAAMESFGRWGAPGGYYGQEARRKEEYNTQNAQRIARAKELRDQSTRQQQMGQQAVGQEQNFKIQKGQLDETARLRAIQQQQEDRLREQGNRPTVSGYQPGQPVGTTDPRTGATTFVQAPGEPKTATPPGVIAEYEYYLKNLQPGEKAMTFIEYQNADANRKNPTPPRQPNPRWVDLRNDQGIVVGAWDMEGGEFRPVPQGAEGLRRTAVPQGANNKIADLENAHRKIEELGTLFDPKFVGPYQGRYEQSKSGGVLSMIPGFETSDEYANFAASQADLKNSVIKLITGAQMGQQEAQRILQQVPTEADKDNVWSAKYQKTIENAKFLMERIKQLTGAGGGAPAVPAALGASPAAPGAAPAAPAGPRRVRIN